MMRSLIKRSIVTMVAVVGVLALSSAASALSFELEWAGSGTQLTGTSFSGSEVVTLEVWASFATPPGLNGFSVSVSWDSAALTLQSCQLAGTNLLPQTTKGGTSYVAGGSFAPLAGVKAKCLAAGTDWQPAIDQQAGYLPYLPGPATFLAGQLVFHVTGAVGGNTVVQSFFNPLADGWGDNNYAFSLNAVFGSATVHVIPEPTTAVLVGVGFLGLLAAGRRRRS